MPPAATSAPLPDPALVAEQRHLAASREALGRMREMVERLDAEGGNAVSTEYLKATLWHRAQALIDDPETALFFGRIDYADPAERFYVGRRHVQDGMGDPMVVDWRADISRPFYRATSETPYGLKQRRRFGFQHGTLTAYEDEHLDRAAEPDSPSRILEAEIERPRVGPMRDIVSTIQPDQDALVRADLDRTICVQGAPGTGKTAVGLHRAAYLLYAHRERLRRTGVLVVGPNDSFLRYIADVLPALGEIDASQTTVEQLLATVAVRGTDTAPAGTLKGDARMAAVIERAVWSHLCEPTEPLVVPRGSVHWRVPTDELAELLESVRSRQVRYAAGRAMLPQRLAHAVLVQMEERGESPDDRVQDAVARTKAVKVCTDAMWPALDPTKLVYRLLTDQAFLAVHADGILDAGEQALLRWSPRPRSIARAAWSAADAALVDEAASLLTRQPSLGHVVLDEAQDLSAMQLRAVGRRCSTGSATVLGDVAQGTTPWAVASWTDALAHLGKPDGVVDELKVGFRVPADILELAARLLPAIAPDLAPPTSVRTERGGLQIRAVSDLVPPAVRAAVEALTRPGSVGLIVPGSLAAAIGAALATAGVPYATMGDPTDIDARLDVVPAALAKGLEFDHVVLVEPAAIAAEELDERTGLRRVYVCLTRAVTTLCVLHERPLPEALRRRRQPSS